MGLFGKKKEQRELTKSEKEEIKNLILKRKLERGLEGIPVEIVQKIYELTNKPAKQCKTIYEEYEKEVAEQLYKKIKE